MADLVLDWSALGAYGTNLENTAPGAVTTTVDTGGVAVDITFSAQSQGAQAFTVNNDGYVPEGSAIDANSHLKLFGSGGDGGTVSPTSTTVLDFRSVSEDYTDEISNVTFILNDVDSGIGSDLGDLAQYASGGGGGTSFADNLTVLAYDADGNPVEVTLTPLGATTSVSGNTVTGDSTTSFAEQDGTVQVSIAGAVSRIEIVYENGGAATQGVLISDVTFETVDTDGGDPGPVAGDDAATTPEDTAVIIDVLANDSDPDGGALAVTGATATNGTVTVNEDNTLTFTPETDYNGPAEITYAIEDTTGNTATGYVDVTVEPVNDDPVANDDTAETDVDTPVTLDPTVNDTDVDGDTLTVSGIGTPTNGTAEINEDGTVTYTPVGGFTGEDTISYTVDDGNGGSDTADIVVTVGGGGTGTGENTAPTALDDFYQTTTTTTVTFDPTSNDSDPDGDPLTISNLGTPDFGSVTQNDDGTITYTPDGTFTGYDSFIYEVSDGNGGTSMAFITVEVQQGEVTNTPPVAVDDDVITDLDTSVTFDPSANDTDADGDPLSVSGVGEASNGTVVLNDDGTVTYTPDEDYDGTDSFTYTVTDGNGGTADGTVNVDVVPCFTPGTLIATPQGERLVEDLQEGDRVITRDNGIQEIRWIGRKEMTGHELARKPHMRPVLIQKGALGRNTPEHDLLVSPNHRILVANDKTSLYFEEREVLAAAKHLTGLEGVDTVETLGVTYIHILFDNHEVILSNGSWTESFQPGDLSLKGVGEAQREEIFELFPELEHQDGLRAYGSARRSLKKHEAQLLTK